MRQWINLVENFKNKIDEGLELNILTRYFKYLDRLRDSGRTNMFGAAIYLEQECGVEENLAKKVLGAWMNTFNEDEDAQSRAMKANLLSEDIGDADWHQKWFAEHVHPELSEISEERWWDALEVLPPLNWIDYNGVNIFFISEALTGDWHQQYGKYHGRYFTKAAQLRDKSTWINAVEIAQFITKHSITENVEEPWGEEADAQSKDEEDEIDMANLISARKHLRHALCNQGIDWDEACEEAETIERRIRARPEFQNDGDVANRLLGEAIPYEDM